jgi:hypothetical protein
LPGRTPQEAVRHYTQALQDALSCVVQGRLVRLAANPFEPDPAIHPIALNGDEPAPLRGPARLYLVVNQNYSIVRTEDETSPRWKVSTRGYFYGLQTEQGAEAVSFHWSPRPGEMIARPHAHVGRRLLSTPITLGLASFDLPRVHIPTGRVALEEVIRMAIQEFAVEPRREDWEQVLERTQSASQRWGSW